MIMLSNSSRSSSRSRTDNHTMMPKMAYKMTPTKIQNGMVGLMFKWPWNRVHTKAFEMRGIYKFDQAAPSDRATLNQQSIDMFNTNLEAIF